MGNLLSVVHANFSPQNADQSVQDARAQEPSETISPSPRPDPARTFTCGLSQAPIDVHQDVLWMKVAQRADNSKWLAEYTRTDGTIQYGVFQPYRDSPQTRKALAEFRINSERGYTYDDNAPIFATKAGWQEVEPTNLSVRTQPSAGLKLSIKTITHKTHSIVVAENATVRDLKVAIQKKTGMPTDKQRLVFQERHLEDELNLKSHYAIENGSRITAVPRLGGN